MKFEDRIINLAQNLQFAISHKTFHSSKFERNLWGHVKLSFQKKDGDIINIFFYDAIVIFVCGDA